MGKFHPNRSGKKVVRKHNISRRNGQLPSTYLIKGCGHMMLLSPKYRPELTGEGIEYPWRMEKTKFRREINYGIPCEIP